MTTELIALRLELPRLSMDIRHGPYPHQALAVYQGYPKWDSVCRTLFYSIHTK